MRTYAEKRATNLKACRKYKAAHPDRVAESARRYRAAHPERNRAAARRWYAAHPEKREERAARSRRWYATHKERAAEQNRRWMAENRDKMREYYRRRALEKRYGITIEQYEAMLAAQGGVCAICQKPPKRNRLSVDHCHRTKVVRGLLCSPCNRLIAHFGDAPETARRCADYLEQTTQ